jgi:hypothetical protein
MLVPNFIVINYPKPTTGANARAEKATEKMSGRGRMPIAKGRKGAAKRPAANRVFYFSTHSISYKQKHIIFFLADFFSEKIIKFPIQNVF